MANRIHPAGSLHAESAAISLTPMNELEKAAARMICIGFNGKQLPSQTRDLLLRGVSSVILFARNYESPRQLAELCHEIKQVGSDSRGRPIMICVDHEGGRVQRFPPPFTAIPSMREVGQTNDPTCARTIGSIMAKELRAVNIDMNLAPVLDVDSNPANPVIGARSFGPTPDVVSRMAIALIDGLQSSGTAACGKHFPGHGDTSIDSHLDLPRLPHDMKRLEAVELPPFKAAIKSGVAAIMTSHVLFETLDAKFPATISAAVIDSVLRQRLGFDRVIISDDLEMKAIADHYGFDDAILRSAMAGIDLFMVCHTHELQHRAIDVLIDASKRGSLPRDRIEQSNRRLDSLFKRFVRPAKDWDERTTVIGCDAHRASISGLVTRTT
jgi:beta-N-acetylhexosaminidase